MTTGYRYAMQQWVSDGIRVNYDISFDGGYLHSTDVLAYREPYNGTNVTGPREDLAVTFTVDNPGNGQTATVRLGASPATPQPTGYLITVYRSTERAAPLVDFENGAVLTGGNLNTAVKQAIFNTAEIADQFNALDGLTQDTISAFDSRLADIEDDVAANTVTANQALTNANAAQVSASGAVATAQSAVNTANATAALLDDAITAANNATAAAVAATSALDTIEDDVNQAVADANQAVATANAASANADALSDLITQANDNATDALNTANAIDAKAQSALDAATQAETDAAAALDAATGAQGALADYMPKAGGTFTGGVSYGSVLGASTTDVTKHISLYSTTYGFGVTNTSFNTIMGTGATWNLRESGGTSIVAASATAFTYKGQGVWHSGNFDPADYGTLANPDFTGSVGITPTTGQSTYALDISSAATGNGRFIRVQNTNTGASTAFCGLTLDANGGGGSLWTFSTNYTSIAILTNKTELQSSDGGLVYSAVNASGNHTWTCGTARTTRMTLSNAGTLAVTSGAVTASGGFQSTSSRRVKTKLRPIRDALKTVDALELVTGQYKRDFVADGRRHYFAIAEQAEMHAPPLVVQDVGEYRGEPVKGFDYDGLSVLNSAAIQELLRIVQMQQEQINELKEMLE